MPTVQEVHSDKVCFDILGVDRVLLNEWTGLVAELVERVEF